MNVRLDLPEAVVDDIVERVARVVVERLQAEQQPDREWMTARECADYLRFPLSRVRNLTSADRIPHVKQDGRVLYHRPALRAWLNAKEEP